MMQIQRRGAVLLKALLALAVLGVVATAAVASELAAPALADWIGPDDRSRPGGAERDWYVANGRPGPANQPFLDRHEIRLERGFENGIPDTLLDIEPGPIVLQQASRPVLALLPGMTPEVLDRFEALAQADSVVKSLPEISAGLPPTAQRAFNEAMIQLVSRSVLEPLSWIVTVRAGAGDPPVAFALEVLLARSGTSVVILRRRSWFE